MIFEMALRWPGAPPICIAENLPAFTTPEALDKFLQQNGPSCKVKKKWLCRACQHWHAKTVAPDPSGSSSGTTRGAKGYEFLSPLEKCLAIGVQVKDGHGFTRNGKLVNGEPVPQWLTQLEGDTVQEIAAEADHHPESWPRIIPRPKSDKNRTKTR